MDKLLKNDIINRGNLIYNYLQEQIKIHKPEKWYESQLEFIINDNKEINGRAWCDNNKDHIEINSGVIDLYYDYFTKIMEQDKIAFLRMLNKEKDDDELKKISYEGIIYKDGIPIIFDSKLVDESKAKLLEIFVSRFIVTHEIGHILNGHCKLLATKSKNEANYIPMYHITKEAPLIPEEALDIRTMEMDADAFATTQSMLHVLYLYFNFDSQVSIKMIETQDIFYWWAFAIRSHFLVCQDRFVDNKYYKKMTHLPSNARWIMVYSTVLKLLDLYTITNHEKECFKKKITQGAVQAEIKFNRIKFSNYNLINEINDNTEFTNYSNEVNNHWEIIKLQLYEYARLPLFNES